MPPELIGMVHLGPLPGAPRFDGDLDAVLARAHADAITLEQAGFDAVLVENFGDAPFHADDVPKVTVGAMAVVVRTLAQSVGIPVGVNVLRNDGLAALAVAATAGAGFIRVNVLSGTMYTDQGPVVGRAAEIARTRAVLDPNVQIYADVFVKHATPPAGLTIEQAATDLVERGGADAVIVSGVGTGSPPEIELVRTVRETIGAFPLLVGSGATTTTVGELLSIADGVIVGSALKPDQDPTLPVHPERAKAFAGAARLASP